MNNRDLQEATGLRITYQRAGIRWKGALKNTAGKTVWTCEHFHKNRDNGTFTFGISAQGCARNELWRRFQCEAA